jgi:hypothetical protein
MSGQWGAGKTFAFFDLAASLNSQGDPGRWPARHGCPVKVASAKAMLATLPTLALNTKTQHHR